MSDTKQTKKASKLGRTQVVTIRLDPKLRYLVELAARKHRRTVSSFLEWAAEQSLSRVLLHEGTGYNGDEDVSVADMAGKLWDVDEAERLVRLALLYPELLTHEEQLIWKAIKDSGLIWQGGHWTHAGWEPDWVKLERDVFPQLRDHWETFKKIASGEIPRNKMPKWEKPKPPQKTSNTFDDDIPF